MKRICHVLFVFILVLIVSACGKKSVEQQIAEQLELGQKYLTEANYEQAIVAFNKVIELEPKTLTAYMGLSDSYMGLGNTEEAVTILETAMTFYDVLQDNEKTDEMIRLYDDLEEKHTRLLNENDERGNQIAIGPDGQEEEKELEQGRISGIEDMNAEECVRQADAVLANGDTALALELLQQAYGLQPDENLEIRILAIQNGGEYEVNSPDEEPPVMRRYDSYGHVVYYERYAPHFISGYYYYDDKGRRIKLEGTEEIDGAEERYIYVYQYASDEDTLPIKQINYDGEGQEVMCYWEYSYDENGNRIERIQYGPEGDLLARYTYDSEGNEISKEKY